MKTIPRFRKGHFLPVLCVTDGRKSGCVMEDIIQHQCQQEHDRFIPFCFGFFFFFSNEVDSVAPMRYCPTANHHDLLPAAAAAWLSLRSFTTATEEQQCDAGREKKHGEDESRGVTCG